jgi:hypothetical protein
MLNLLVRAGPPVSRRRGRNYQINLKKPSARSCCWLGKAAHKRAHRASARNSSTHTRLSARFFKVMQSLY